MSSQLIAHKHFNTLAPETQFYLFYLNMIFSVEYVIN